MLRVHHVLRRIFDFDGLEGARAHVQEEVDPADASRLERLEQVRREMKSGGRSGDRPWLARVHGLVAVDVRRRRRRGGCTAAAERARGARSPRQAGRPSRGERCACGDRSPARSTTSNPGAMWTTRPACSFPPGCTIASYCRVSPVGRSRKTSAGAPESRRPSSRARNTRVVFRTSASPARDDVDEVREAPMLEGA